MEEEGESLKLKKLNKEAKSSVREAKFKKYVYLYERLKIIEGENNTRNETTISKNQFRFMPGISTKEQIFCMRLIVDKYKRRKKLMNRRNYKGYRE